MLGTMEGVFESEKRFGVIAIERGFVTLDQLLDAIRSQVEDDCTGKPHRLLGRILCEHGAMTYPQVGEVLLLLGRPEPVLG